MIDIQNYILFSQKERTKHLRLREPCNMRGGSKQGVSGQCKALLAYILDTSIPSGNKIYVCHACNQAMCSNPYHLYWGTAKENYQDSIKNGGKSIWENLVLKYGKVEALNRLKSHFHREGCAKGGRAGKGVPKSLEHRKKISDTMLDKQRGLNKSKNK